MKKTIHFEGIKNLQELKKRYKELVYKFHPDRESGNEEIMKQVNNEYEYMFEYIKANPQTEAEQKTYKYANINDGFREALKKVIFFEGLEIEICGSWIWIGAENTYPIRKQISEAGFHWAGQKRKWYWKPEDYQNNYYKGKKGWSMEKIRDTYGSEKVETKSRIKLEKDETKK